jgi:periplasmic protein TonB
MNSSFSPDHWGSLLNTPIARWLLLSAALHLAFILLFQSSPINSGRQVVVIDAHLQQAEAQSHDAVEPVEEAVEEALDEVPRAQTPQKTEAVASEPISMPVMAAPGDIVMPDEHAEPVASVASEPSGTPVPNAAEAERGPTQSSMLPSLPIGIDNTWYLAKHVDRHPKAIGRIAPIYPEHAKRRDIEGTLKLMLKIDELGRVQAAEVVEAIPPGVFDEAALAAFREARFQPALKDGRAVRYQAYMRVEFKLED